VFQGWTAEEMTMWKAYYRVEPFGEERADWRAAQMPTLYYNS
jgi:hypothetical protein